MNKLAYIKGYMEKSAAPKWVKMYRQGKIGLDDIVKIMQEGNYPRMLKKLKDQAPGNQVRALIHQGSPEFNPNLINPIKNRKYNNKPAGGLWATPGGSKDQRWVDEWSRMNSGWTHNDYLDRLNKARRAVGKDYLKESDILIPPKTLDQTGFVLEVNPKARVATIDTLDDLKALVRKYPAPDYEGNMKMINYEALAKDYDMIHLTSDGQHATRGTSMFAGRNDPDLYGWDFESNLVLNPEKAIKMETK